MSIFRLEVRYTWPRVAGYFSICEESGETVIIWKGPGTPPKTVQLDERCRKPCHTGGPTIKE